jgi:hypothetical protein
MAHRNEFGATDGGSPSQGKAYKPPIHTLRRVPTMASLDFQSSVLLTHTNFILLGMLSESE